jgi:hypothetical protein
MQRVETKAKTRGVGERSQSIIIFYSDEAEAYWRELELGCSSVGVQWSKVLLYSRHSKCDSSETLLLHSLWRTKKTCPKLLLNFSLSSPVQSVQKLQHARYKQTLSEAEHEF